MELADKLNPARFTAMSGKMAAIVGFILGETWTSPRIWSLSITSDGFLLANGANEFIGSADDLADNIARLMDAADLDPSERAEFSRLYRSRVNDWRNP